MKVFFVILISISNLHASEEVALAKIKEFGEVLKKELRKGLKESPVKAVGVCNIRAPEIQKQVSVDGIKIGRVSQKNRNPQNLPKKWMKTYINQFHENKVSKKYIVADLRNGRKGLIKPIKTMPLCLKCHGSGIEESLRSEISSKYPKDKATGYKVGEIRGFFWAEF